MSRSNNPMNRGGTQPRDWQRPAPDAAAHPGDHQASPQPYQWPSLGQQQDSYGHPQGAPSYPGQQHHGQEPEAPCPAYHYPQENGGQQPNTGAPVQHPPFFGSQQSNQPAPAPIPFASQFERYLNAHQQDPYQQQEQDPAAGKPDYGRHPAQFQDDGLAQLQQLTQQRQQHNSLRDQLRSTQHDQWQQQNAPDPRNYDLGSYMPSGAQGGGYGEPEHPQSYDHQWQGAGGYGGQGPDAHSGHHDGYYAQHGESLPVPGQPDDHDHDDADYEYEEPRRSRRGLVIVGALVGAILVGGGMAYGYKMVIGPGSKSAPPVIRADQRPSKIQPAEPGGKQFAHSDSKLMGRLEADAAGGGAAAAASRALAETSEETENGVRKVSTVMVGRDGSIAPPSEPRLPPTNVAVPGMTIVDGFGGRPQQSLPPPRPIEPIRTAPQAVVPPPAPTPQVVTPTPQLVAKAPPPQAEPEPAPARRAAPPPPAAAPPARTAAVAPAPRTSSGYVAVLSSQRSRMDALKTFADLQQKYTNVLQNKIPDVQEADLSARGLGTMYRVVVGPPSSREAAADVCGQLRSAGFQGCWITAY